MANHLRVFTQNYRYAKGKETASVMDTDEENLIALTNIVFDSA
jgi:hypothetical protein